MFCNNIFPRERTGSMFLFEFRLTNRISSWSITSSIDNKSSYCPVTADSNVTAQQRLNFEMSVKNLMQSLEDRERVPKIQGLINECMTFLDDELSAVTGQYDDLLSIEDVIDQELILFVSLNANKNTEPVRSLGKMLLQNIQLTVGK